MAGGVWWQALFYLVCFILFPFIYAIFECFMSCSSPFKKKIKRKSMEFFISWFLVYMLCLVFTFSVIRIDTHIWLHKMCSLVGLISNNKRTLFINFTDNFSFNISCLNCLTFKFIYANKSNAHDDVFAFYFTIFFSSFRMTFHSKDMDFSLSTLDWRFSVFFFNFFCFVFPPFQPDLQLDYTCNVQGTKTTAQCAHNEWISLEAFCQTLRPLQKQLEQCWNVYVGILNK